MRLIDIFQENCYFFLQVKSRFAINKRKMEEKKKEYDFDQRMAELKEEEERQKEFKKQKKVTEEKRVRI
jgi:U4/U6.U5 tri-snRNP component SNU23